MAGRDFLLSRWGKMRYTGGMAGGSWMTALAGDLAHWADSDRGLMALVLLLDQFTRNIYRGTPRAFAGDPGALALASTAGAGAAMGGGWRQGRSGRRRGSACAGTHQLKISRT